MKGESDGCQRSGRWEAGVTVLLRQQQQVGERQALDICTSPVQPPFHQLPARRRGRRHGTQYYGGSLFSREVVGKSCQTAEKQLHRRTPLRPLPQWLAAPFLGLCITGSSPRQAGGDCGGECGSSSRSHALSLAPAHAPPLAVGGGVTNPTTVCSARRWQGKHN